MKGALLGFGTMGQTHLSRYVQLGVEIVAIVDPDPARRADVAQLGLPTCAGLGDLLQLQGPTFALDFMDICTPTHLHYEQIWAAHAAGLALFVEKPVVRTRAEVAALRALSPARPIFVGEVEHYNPHLVPFLEEQARPRQVEISREVDLAFFLRGAHPWFLDERLSGGLILDCMIHDINLLVAKYGAPQVHGAQGQALRHGLIDEASTILAFPDFLATVRCTWVSARTDSPVVTTIRWETAENGTREVCCADYALRDRPAALDPFTLELEAFIHAVRTGQVPHALSTYLDGIDVALDIMDRLRTQSF